MKTQGSGCDQYTGYLAVVDERYTQGAICGLDNVTGLTIYYSPGPQASVISRESTNSGLLVVLFYMRLELNTKATTFVPDL